MNKTFSKILSIALAVVMVLSLSTSAFAASNEGDSDMSYVHISSTEDYKNWVASRANVRNSNNSEVQTFLNEFDKLTEAEQNLFVSYVTDSDLILEVLNSLFISNSSVKLQNGDVIISNTNDFDNEEKVVVSRTGIQNRIGTGSKSVSVLGLKVFEYSGEIRYSHDGSSIKTISHANNWISTNWIPLVSFSWDDESTYGVGTTVAHHIEYCTWSFVHEKLGLTYGAHQVEITGSVKNKTTFSVS